MSDGNGHKILCWFDITIKEGDLR